MSVSSTSTRRGSPTGIGSGKSGALDRLQANLHWARLPLFDRKGWTTVRFGDVARILKEQVDPVADGVERYVAGEHMATEDVHIRKWGTVGDGYLGPAFIRRFRKGQVLYGSRRTYLKKVAVAEWDGVTANTTFVLEAVKERLLPGLLPWLMLSERFTKHSVAESKGSTNPYINFPDIAKFEFALPPLDQQRRLAEVLWSVDALIEERNKVLAASISALTASNEEFFERASARVEPLSSAIRDSAYGPRFSNSLYSADGAIAQVRTTDISEDGVINYGTIPRVDLKATTMSGHILEDGDFLISRSGTCGIGAVFRDSGIPTIPGAFLIRLRLNARLLPDFLREYINSPVGRKHMDRLAAGGVQKNIRGSSLFAESVPIPSVEEQAEFLESCRTQRALVALCRDAKAKTKELLMSIGNTIFASS